MIELAVIVLLQAAVVIWGVGCAILITTEVTLPHQRRPPGWPWVIPLWPAAVAMELWRRRKRSRL